MEGRLGCTCKILPSRVLNQVRMCFWLLVTLREFSYVLGKFTLNFSLSIFVNVFLNYCYQVLLQS